MPKEQRSSESRVRENRMHGSMGGGWKRSVRHRASRLPYRTHLDLGSLQLSRFIRLFVNSGCCRLGRGLALLLWWGNAAAGEDRVWSWRYPASAPAAAISATQPRHGVLRHEHLFF